MALWELRIKVLHNRNLSTFLKGNCLTVHSTIKKKRREIDPQFFVHKSQSFGAILMSAHIKSVTRFGEISPRLQNFIVFGHFKGFWYLAKQIEPTLANFYAAEQFFTDANDQRLKIISASGHTACGHKQ